MKDVIGVEVRSITTDHVQKLYIDGEDAAMMRGKRILIVDDVISTGESLTALEKLVEKAGGNICGRMAILAEGDAQEREVGARRTGQAPRQEGERSESEDPDCERLGLRLGERGSEVDQVEGVENGKRRADEPQECVAELRLAESMG